MFGGTAGISAGLNFYGTDHVVFASDAPFGPIDACLAALAPADLDEAARQQVLYANAARLLKLR
jgi:aminocarboxymuconate-semialdehyde decarboxylase